MNENGLLYDVIVIGGGPAGASAAVYAARGGLDVALLHGGVSALHRARRIDNYYGAKIGTSGRRMYDAGIVHAADLGVRVVREQVVAVEHGEVFTVHTSDGSALARRVILATGAAHKTPDIDGLKKFEGRGVSYCAVCDGFFFRKKRIAVLGAGELAKHEYGVLAPLASQITLLTDGQKSAFMPERVIKSKIARLEGDGALKKVVFKNGKKLETDGLFVAVGVADGSALARTLGVAMTAVGEIKTDENMMTNLDGLYAAGDCTAGIKQIARAVAEGMTAGLAAVKSLKGGN